ncbi:MAG: serine/threonine protein kinase [Sandaracinaceae bacterium]|nr:serine/threonine protein kinase [Sandaracinaceae bacterium]
MHPRPPFNPNSLPPGMVLAGKYELAQPIGWGENSVVYEATHKLLERKAAVKVLAKTDEESERRFAREAKLAGSLSHPNIVEIYEVGRLEDGRAFLAMEFLVGETLEERLLRIGPFSIHDAMKAGQELLYALAVAHENQIVHRDLRPQNVFMAETRDGEVLKVLDFGVSRRFGGEGDSILTRPGSFLGDIQYIAPEQLYEDGSIDQRTDIYAVGVLLYRLLTGSPPFTGRTAQLLIAVTESMPPAPSTRRPELTSDVDRVILTALAKKPADRFQDAESMAEALRLTSLFSSYVTS